MRICNCRYSLIRIILVVLPKADYDAAKAALQTELGSAYNETDANYEEVLKFHEPSFRICTGILPVQQICN